MRPSLSPLPLSPRRSRTLGGWALAALLAAACAHTPAGPPPLGTIDYATVEGDSGTLAAHHGKVVVVDVCAASFDPCLVNARAVSEACDAMCRRGAVVITLLLDDLGPPAVHSYKNLLGAKQEVYLAGERVKRGESALGPIEGVPRLVVIDKEGAIALDVVGAVVDATVLSARIAELMED